MGKGEMRYRRLHQLAPTWTSRSLDGLEEDSLFSRPWWEENVIPTRAISILTAVKTMSRLQSRGRGGGENEVCEGK